VKSSRSAYVSYVRIASSSSAIKSFGLVTAPPTWFSDER